MSEALTTTPQPESPKTHELVRFMDLTSAQEIFATPDTTQEFIRSISYERFEEFLNRVNGICRAKPIKTRDMDGTGHIVEGNALVGTSTLTYEPPAVADRRPLMQQVFQAVQAASNLEQAATILGLSINITHPYLDGNGRTSRFVYSLLTHGYNGTIEDKDYFADLLENNEGRKVVDLDPQKAELSYRFNAGKRREIASKFSYKGPLPTYSYGGYDADGFDNEDETNILTNSKVSPVARSALHHIVHDSNFETTILMQFILKSGRNFEEYVKSYDKGKRVVLVLNKLIPELTDADIYELCFDEQPKLKKEYAQAVVSALTDPNQKRFLNQLTDFYRPKVKSGT